jgi:hypothetical protein
MVQLGVEKYGEAGLIRNFMRVWKNHNFQLQYDLKDFGGQTT